ncbi:hypothetical protein CIPAW_09G149900 [Carya illinoinensis]|uniref:Cathepsin propeptide inhibitor domain-containing protein n=1 Tax=Carya illinoinensis TaxID=32201 RepID=A0A8T1PLG2_CARIL|nr:hypothetical protein CIPAW_09G149900 [Carya illinoinensis]
MISFSNEERMEKDQYFRDFHVRYETFKNQDPQKVCNKKLHILDWNNKLLARRDEENPTEVHREREREREREGMLGSSHATGIRQSANGSVYACGIQGARHNPFNFSPFPSSSSTSKPSCMHCNPVPGNKL